MNKRQLKALLKQAGVTRYEISGQGQSLEIEVSATAKTKLRRAGLQWGGYRTGAGRWVLQANYVDLGDPMDKGSLRNYR